MNQSTPPAASGEMTQASAQVTPVQGLLVLAAVVVFVAGFLLLNHVMGLTEDWAGFLFLVCWSFGQLDPSKLPQCAVGAFIGVLVAYAMQRLLPTLGLTALVPILGVILVMVYCQIMGWFTLLVNLTTMTFLTIAAMPLVQTNVSFPNLFATLAFGVVYFAGLVQLGRWFAGRAAAKRSADPGAAAPH